MSVVAVPLIVDITPGPPTFAVGPTPPEKSFKFQINPGEDIDPKDKFDAVFEVFARANLVTANRRRGIVGMDILLNGRSVLQVLGLYDPSDFPADQVFSNSATTTRTISNLTRSHKFTVKAIGDTEFTDTTVFYLRAKFHAVT